jgi:hypothetical protein
VAAVKPVAWMVGASVASGALVCAMVPDVSVEVLLGMAGPLLVATGSWVLAERTYRRNPIQLTTVMILAFGAKLVFFGAYVAVILSVLSIRPVAFAVSLTCYFIALHLTEAFFLRSLFLRGATRSR